MKAAKGDTPRKISKTKINLLRPEDVWHPKRGAPWGNRNAQTHGAHTREMRAMRRYARTLICESRAAIAAFYAEEERRLAERTPAP